MNTPYIPYDHPHICHQRMGLAEGVHPSFNQTKQIKQSNKPN
jgi:hypothetical protein